MMMDLTFIITLNENGYMDLLKSRDYQQVITSIQCCFRGKTIRWEKKRHTRKEKAKTVFTEDILCVKQLQNYQQNIY